MDFIFGDDKQLLPGRPGSARKRESKKNKISHISMKSLRQVCFIYSSLLPGNLLRKLRQIILCKTIQRIICLFHFMYVSLGKFSCSIIILIAKRHISFLLIISVHVIGHDLAQKAVDFCNKNLVSRVLCCAPI